jgi:large subunit ribosomal protein L3
MLSLIGKKIGMTQIFEENGNVVPVTAVKVEPNVVVGERTKEKHGYDAVILGAVSVRKKRLTKPVIGQFPEGTEPTRYLVEVRNFDRECQIGEKLGPEIFQGIRFVDVQGLSKGKGYQGVVKRHGFGGGRKSHGSKFHRTPGSTGNAASPSKVFKGSKMAGRMGAATATVQNLSLVSVDPENSLLLIKGSVPGARNGVVVVKKAKKK